jgi:hypothetical protein
VGRVVVSGKAGSEQLRIDLKGVVYRALVLPLATSALVLNIGPSEAKVGWVAGWLGGWVAGCVAGWLAAGWLVLGRALAGPCNTTPIAWALPRGLRLLIAPRAWCRQPVTG